MRSIAAAEQPHHASLCCCAESNGSTHDHGGWAKACAACVGAEPSLAMSVSNCNHLHSWCCMQFKGGHMLLEQLQPQIMRSCDHQCDQNAAKLQGFRSPEEVRTFGRVLEEMAHIVAIKHGGSLKVGSALHVPCICLCKPYLTLLSCTGKFHACSPSDCALLLVMYSYISSWSWCQCACRVLQTCSLHCLSAAVVLL